VQEATFHLKTDDGSGAGLTAAGIAFIFRATIRN
jgi:hypothetical protein